eukprot:1746640-Prymnesium_polylepis.2
MALQRTRKIDRSSSERLIVVRVCALGASEPTCTLAIGGKPPAARRLRAGARRGRQCARRPTLPRAARRRATGAS